MDTLGQTVLTAVATCAAVGGVFLAAYALDALVRRLLAAWRAHKQHEREEIVRAREVWQRYYRELLEVGLAQQQGARQNWSEVEAKQRAKFQQLVDLEKLYAMQPYRRNTDDFD